MFGPDKILKSRKSGALKLSPFALKEKDNLNCSPTATTLGAEAVNSALSAKVFVINNNDINVKNILFICMLFNI